MFQEVILFELELESQIAEDVNLSLCNAFRKKLTLNPKLTPVSCTNVNKNIY